MRGSLGFDIPTNRREMSWKPHAEQSPEQCFLGVMALLDAGPASVLSGVSPQLKFCGYDRRKLGVNHVRERECPSVANRRETTN